jgi:preprotein translocase subunit YajC
LTSILAGLVALVWFGVVPAAHSLVEFAPASKFGLLAQETAVAPESPASTTPSGANSPAAKQPEDMTMIERIFASGIILPVGLVVLFYAIFLAPERRRKAEEAKLMAGLKKNDRVVTIGGIHGTVANVTSDSDIVTPKVDESTGARIRVNRSAIARIVSEPTSSDKEAPADDSAK